MPADILDKPPWEDCGRDVGDEPAEFPRECGGRKSRGMFEDIICMFTAAIGRQGRERR